MPFEKSDDELGALWLKTSSSGNEYLSGTIEGVGQVVCFKAKPTEKGPAWRVLKSKPRENGAPTRPPNARPPRDAPLKYHEDDEY